MKQSNMGKMKRQQPTKLIFFNKTLIELERLWFSEIQISLKPVGSQMPFQGRIKSVVGNRGKGRLVAPEETILILGLGKQKCLSAVVFTSRYRGFVLLGQLLLHRGLACKNYAKWSYVAVTIFSCSWSAQPTGETSAQIKLFPWYGAHPQALPQCFFLPIQRHQKVAHMP